MKPQTIVILLFVLLFLIILIQNTQVVTLHLLFWNISMSQIVLIFLTLLVGLIAGFVLCKVTKKQSGDS